MKNHFNFRPFNPETDQDAVIRIWKECGWLKEDVKDIVRKTFGEFLADSNSAVAACRDEAECLVTTHKASIRMLHTELPLCAVTSVTVSRLLRQQGAAGHVLARSLANAAERGDAVTALGIFDQGFYNKFGFGSFPYAHSISVDPKTFNVPSLKRIPVRLSAKDIPRMVVNMAERRPCHGMVSIPYESFHHFVILDGENGFGLGFEDERGCLTHHFWGTAKGENGPYEICWTAYRNYGEFLELLSLMKSLGDQVFTVKLREPPGIQIQDLIKRPFRQQNMITDGDHLSAIRASSWAQARILNLPAVLSALNIPGGQVDFNLNLEDPIQNKLPEDSTWTGIGGEWTIRLSEAGSSAEKGHSPGLPLMKASVNALTRLLFGVKPASGLAVTEDMDAPETLINELDARLRLPLPDMVQLF